MPHIHSHASRTVLAVTRLPVPFRTSAKKMKKNSTERIDSHESGPKILLRYYISTITLFFSKKI